MMLPNINHIVDEMLGEGSSCMHGQQKHYPTYLATIHGAHSTSTSSGHYTS